MFARVRYRPDLRSGLGDLLAWTCANGPLDSEVKKSLRSGPPNRRKRAAPAPRAPLGEFGKALPI